MKNKAAQKLVRKNLKLSLVKELTENLQKLGAQNADQLDKFIQKSSKQLAKKLAKRVTVDINALENKADAATTNEPKAEQPATKPAKAKPAKKKAAAAK
jgi:hypothetical protein